MSAVSSKFEAHLTAHSLIDRGRKSIVMPPKRYTRRTSFGRKSGH